MTLKKPTPLELARWSPAGLAHYTSDGAWQIAKHLAYLDERLRALARREIRRLMIFMPPRHGKSELVSVHLPAWVIGALGERILMVSHDKRLAEDFNQRALDIMREHGPEVFQKRVDEKAGAGRSFWRCYEGGQIFATGVGGSITGKGADWFIMDDLVKDHEAAMSPTQRKWLVDWFRSTASTRLQPNAVMLLMMTRWHEEDLAGVLLEEQPERWEVIRFPGIAEEDDILGREPGDVLWPEFWTPEAMRERLQDMSLGSEGYDWWEAMVQQNPSSPEGNKIKADWWQWYEPDEPLPLFDVISVVTDSASKTKDHNAFSCSAVWGRAKNGYYLIDLRRGRVEFPDLLKWSHDFEYMYPECMHVVEDTSNGTALIQTLQRETRYNVVPVEVHNDKGARLSAVMPIIEGGNCYLPKSAPWLRDFLTEHRKFPATTFKDQVDTTSLALTYLAGKGTPVPEGTKIASAPKRDNSLFYEDISIRDLRVPRMKDV